MATLLLCLLIIFHNIQFLNTSLELKGQILITRSFFRSCTWRPLQKTFASIFERQLHNKRIEFPFSFFNRRRVDGTLHISNVYCFTARRQTIQQFARSSAPLCLSVNFAIPPAFHFYLDLCPSDWQPVLEKSPKWCGKDWNQLNG